MDNQRTEYYRLDSKNDFLITEINETENQTNEKEKDLYFISEPFDYIFEPDHYPKPTSNNNKPKIEDINNDAKFKHATIKGEIDGILEYEYKSYSYNNITNFDNLNLIYSSDEKIDYETHLNALIRGISLIKWPNVGFGFSLARNKIDNKIVVYVCEIASDSPAEFCLQLGDILVEMDDMNLSDDYTIENLNKYLEDKDQVHLMVIHPSKYAQLKSENSNDMLKNCFVNCEDIVICSYASKHEQNI